MPQTHLPSCILCLLLEGAELEMQSESEKECSWHLLTADRPGTENREGKYVSAEADRKELSVTAETKRGCKPAK